MNRPGFLPPWPVQERSRRGLALALLLLLPGLGLSGMAQAQTGIGQAVQTMPSTANSGEGSSTLSGTNVFQQIFAATGLTSSGVPGAIRRGCFVQNTSTHQQYVYFQGPGMTTPTSANSATLEASAIALDFDPSGGKQGGSVTCATGGGSVLQDSIWIAGTSGDAFVAKQQ